jgi:hypothetical protein
LLGRHSFQRGLIVSLAIPRLDVAPFVSHAARGRCDSCWPLAFLLSHAVHQLRSFAVSTNAS